MSTLLLVEQIAPATPSTNQVLVYAKSDGRLYIKDDAGTEYPLALPAITTTDNALARYNGTAGDLQNSGVFMDDLNQLTLPSQPAFLAYNSVTDVDVTGNNIAYTVDLDTEVFDNNADFALDTFTAPVTGRYVLIATVGLNDITATNTDGRLAIVTSNRTYYQYFNPGNQEASAAFGIATFEVMVVADMDASDTATVQITIQQGTQIIDVAAGVDVTRFSGWLLG